MNAGRWFRRAAAALLLLLSAGCGLQPQSDFPFVGYEHSLLAHTEQATENLMAGLRHPVPDQGPLLVASLADINDLATSSPFGRVVSEQMGAHLTKAGYRVLDARLQSRIFVKKGEGEFLLSREVREASRSYNASAVLVGTYAEAEDTVLVSVRLVRSRDSLVLAATNFTLPKTPQIQSLLSGF